MVSCASSGRKVGRFRPCLRHHPLIERPTGGALESLLDDEGVSIDAGTGFPTWEGGPVDYGWAIEGMWSIGRSG